MENQKQTETEPLFQEPEIDEELTEQQEEQFDQCSRSFVGQWNQLISTTNWDKGEIIHQWRSSLEDSGLPAASYTDDRWSKTVGGVTPQHVGRLRRTYSRFGHVSSQYTGLYWSHFYAALDWDDAELWLEGAVQNGWSVSQMRGQRWETMGKVPAERPKITDIVVTEAEEEAEALTLSGRVSANQGEVAEGPIYEGPDFGDADDPSRATSKRSGDAEPGVASSLGEGMDSAARVRPFESFTDLPDDLSDASSMFKIAIIRHKADQWQEISREEVVGLLDALKQLTVAASE
ncbi:MAG: hypothetical protein MK108_02255 [Mariniblastus sp.]|nr:hypothetical protein [Mariniblastus sp.]